MLIIVFGLPGSGKTYFASALAEALKCDHINTDVIRKNHANNPDYSVEGRNKIYDLMLEQCGEKLKNNQNLIVDGTFLKENLRRLFTEKARGLGEKTYFIEISADEEVIRKRVSRKRKYSDADYSVYEKLKSEFEPLKEDHLIIYSDTMEKEEMVLEARKFLNIS